jgi:hypothetical protein
MWTAPLFHAIINPLLDAIMVWIFPSLGRNIVVIILMNGLSPLANTMVYYEGFSRSFIWCLMKSALSDFIWPSRCQPSRDICGRPSSCTAEHAHFL